MTHYMKLRENPFIAMKTGYKTIELRLNDEKRQTLNIGDSIVFQSIDSPSNTKFRFYKFGFMYIL